MLGKSICISFDGEQLKITKVFAPYCNKNLILLSIYTNHPSASEKRNQELVNIACNYLSTKDIDAHSTTKDTNNGSYLFKHEYRLSCIMLEENSLTIHLHNELIWLERNNKETNSLGESKPKIAFLFTGQGSQYPQMGKGFYENSSIFRKAFDECSKILENNLPVPIESIVYGSNSTMLDSSLYSQTSIFCLEYALVQLWKSIGIVPDFVLGPSAGAFCAAYTAGILSLHDALTLIKVRGELIQKLPTGGMTSVRSTVPEVMKILSFLFEKDSILWLDIAVINSPDDIVVAGRPESLVKFETYCFENSIKYLRLAANQAFHSRDINGIYNEYEQVLSQVNFKSTNCSYISGVNGKVVEEFTSKYWQSHARDPVDFPSAIHTLYNAGVRVFIEIGPQPTLLTVGKHNLGIEKVNQSTWLSALKKNELEWDTLQTNIQRLFLLGFDISI